ncbi:MAG: ABC transporter ATP-binding protein, partial [Blautia sp.]
FLPVILLFFLVGSGIKEPMEDMMVKVLDSNHVIECMNRIDHVLRQEEVSETGTGNPQAYDVTFENVSFSYTQGIPVVRNVSFSLPAGSVTGFVGPSGGGKSTLAQLLLRFYEPEEGHIYIGGTDIRDISPEKLTNLVSYVFQENFLFHDTIENNIRMGNQRSSREEVEQAAQNAGIHDVIINLPRGYETVIGEQDAYLSGGEKQRLAIARVFLRDTPIVILDEATAYADAENETKIQQAFARLSKGKTVLMIAHRLKTVERADNLIVIEQGELKGVGTHENLMGSCPLYAEMVAANERKDRWTIKQCEEGGSKK